MMSVLKLIPILIPIIVIGQTTRDQKIPEFLSTIYPKNKPGAVILVKQDSEIRINQGFGCSDFENGTMMNPDHVFPIGSMTKAFTATAIMMLAERNLLSTEDSLTKFFPDLPEVYNKVKISTMLSNTSGIKTYNINPEYNKYPNKEQLSLDDMIFFSTDHDLEFTPGSRFRYSNSNYIFLTKIIERLSGHSYRDFINNEILERAGLRSTFFDMASVNGRIPEGYSYVGKEINKSFEDVYHTYGAGMLLSTSRDISKFIDALLNEKLVTQKSVDYLFSVPLEHKDGRPDEYARGFWITNLENHRTIKMEGYCTGFYTNAFFIPDLKIQIVLLPNTSGFPRPDMPDFIARWIMRYLTGRAVQIYEKTDLSESQLRRFEGVYRVDEKTTRQVMVKDGKLYTLRTGGQTMEAIPYSDKAFYYPNTFTSFEFEVAEDSVTGMVMTDDDGQVQDCIKTALSTRQPAEISKILLNEYAGRYDFGFRVFSISAGLNKLVVHDGRNEFEIYAENDSSFFPWHDDSHWVFRRDTDGKVVQLLLKTGQRELPAARISGN